MNRRRHRGQEFMDPGTFFETVVVTVLTVVTLITLILAFMYMIFAKEKTPTAKT